VIDLRHFRTLARNWEALAQSDPLFAILSDPAKAGGRWDVADFFASGEAHVKRTIEVIEALGITMPSGGCLDFGCGVGRLTRPWAARFARTVGVDVSRSMIRAARASHQAPPLIEFVHNRHPDLRLFASESFDLVHTSLVLQHIPPDISLRYIREFFRVTKPGGLVVFQIPSERIPEDVITARYALPEGGHLATLEIVNAPERLDAGEQGTAQICITNRSPVAWRHDLPPERAVRVGNHWHADGILVQHDDGRGALPRTLEPGESAIAELVVRAPDRPGSYELEIDLLQENIIWFAEKSPNSVRCRVIVSPPTGRAAGPSYIQRVRRWLQGGTATFEMHAVPRPLVEAAISESRGILLQAREDNAADARWLSYSYICRKS